MGGWRMEARCKMGFVEGEEDEGDKWGFLGGGRRKRRDVITQGTVMERKSPYPSRIGDPYASTPSSVMVTAGRQATMTLLTAHLQHAPPGSEAQGLSGNSALGSLMARRADQLLRVYRIMYRHG